MLSNLSGLSLSYFTILHFIGKQCLYCLFMHLMIIMVKEHSTGSLPSVHTPWILFQVQESLYSKPPVHSDWQVWWEVSHIMSLGVKKTTHNMQKVCWVLRLFFLFIKNMPAQFFTKPFLSLRPSLLSSRSGRTQKHQSKEPMKAGDLEDFLGSFCS